MSFGLSMDPITGQAPEDQLIAKAFESLRVEFGQKMDNFQSFAGDNWERARLILQVEGRNTQTVVDALRPFAVGACSMPARMEKIRRDGAARWQNSNPHMARMIGKELL